MIIVCHTLCQSYQGWDVVEDKNAAWANALGPCNECNGSLHSIGSVYGNYEEIRQKFPSCSVATARLWA